MSHKDKLRTGPTNEAYREGYKNIFTENLSNDNEWEKTVKNGKTTYRKKHVK